MTKIIITIILVNIAIMIIGPYDQNFILNNYLKIVIKYIFSVNKVAMTSTF